MITSDMSALCLTLSITLLLITTAALIFEDAPEPVTLYVDDRLEACEAAGGRYNLFWNSYSNSYSERCEVVEDTIESF